MQEDVLLIEEKNQVAWITLNRPDVMNAFNFSMLNALNQAIENLRFRKDIRAIVITGKGEKSFCSGADLKERATLSDMEVKRFIFTIRNLFTSIEYLGKPVISAINGVAFGGGLELALSTDIRIASKTAIMGLTETRLAIIPGAGGTQRLPRLIGKGKAKEFIFTGKRVSADEAEKVGLVNKVCEPDQLMAECEKMTAMILETGPIAIEQAKYAVNQGCETDLHTGLAIESNAYWITIPTEDRLEGLAAFREKRKPVFKGK
ncbi:MAG: enoyl-CoA hydratase/isomerase family protein [Proteobacteria bacterium]|nr:enoyl-CoA hydratase/isomerase family protein [Pseudomonadota bacterium]